VLSLRLPGTGTLVVSQIVLSFGIPFALVPLVWLTARTDVMGAFLNRWVTTVAAGGCAVLISGLNLWLVIKVVVPAGEAVARAVWHVLAMAPAMLG
jgi:manganese transport protein